MISFTSKRELDNPVKTDRRNGTFATDITEYHTITTIILSIS